MPNGRFIVTGSAGWLGKALVHALADGMPDYPELPTAKVIKALVLPDQDASDLKAIGENVHVVTGDIQNVDDCKKLLAGEEGSILIHTAGIIHPKNVRQFFDINVNGTANIAQAAKDAKLERGVFVSSNSPCGNNPHPDHLFDESSPYHPYMNYGRSKMEMELRIKEILRDSATAMVIVRPPWFYGPYQPPRQTLFFQMIRDGKMPIVGTGNNLRSMAYTDNLCAGLILAATSPKAAGQTYWIADERPYAMNEIVDTVERLLETEFGQKCAHKRMRLPGVASEVALIIDATLQKLGLYHQKFHVLSEMNKTIACSIYKAQDELGYQPRVALEEGMRRSIKWCIGQKLL